jgi:Secretion system C-terminal sorting domain
MSSATGLDATTNVNTVSYSGASQTIRNVNYHNLNFSGSGIKTLQGSTISIAGAFNLTGTTSTTTVTAMTVGSLSVGDGCSFAAAGFNITVNGTTTIGNGTSGTISITSTAGTKTFIGLLTISQNAIWDNSINENIRLNGGITNYGTFNAGTGTYTFENNSQVLTGSFIMATVSVNDLSLNGLTVTNNGVLTISTSLTGTGSLSQGTGATLNLGGDYGITSLIADAAPNTVNYTGTGNPKAVNYSSLSVSGTGTRNLLIGTNTISGNLSLGGSITTNTSDDLLIGGNFSVGDGVTFNINGYDLTVTGATSVGGGSSGVINFPSSVGEKIFMGLVTVSNGATWNNSTNNEDLFFQGGITNYGTFIAGTSQQTFEINNQALTGDFTIPRIDIDAITLTVNDDLIVGISLSGSGSIAMNTSTNIQLNGTAILGSFIAPDFGSFVSYGYAAPILIPGSYGNLALNQLSGTASLSAPTEVRGTLQLWNGNLNIGPHTLTLGDTAHIYNPTPSATSMIVASGGGEIRKVMTSTGSFSFPVGDLTTTPEYSPVTVNLTAGSGFSNAYVSVKVTNAKHPSNNSPTHFLSRYWSIGQSGITGAIATITSTYTAADINGTEGSIKAAQLNGALDVTTNGWKKSSTALSGNTLNFVDATLTNGQISTFSGISAAGPTLSITGGGITICVGGSTQLGATVTGDPSLTYEWSPAAGLSATNIVNPVSTINSATTYTLKVYDANGDTGIASTTLSTQQPTILADAITICEGSTGTLSASGAVSYTWSPSTGLSATSGTSVNANPTTTTVYTITGTDANTCQGTKQVTVNVNPKPVITVNSPSVCAGTPVNLTASGGLSYTWSPGTGLSSTAGNPVTATISSTSTYIVTGININNCTNTASAVVTITPLPAKPTISGIDLGSETPRLTSSSTTGNQWYKNGNIITGAISQNLDVTEDGSYTVIVTNSGCTSVTSDAYVIVITGLGDQSGFMKLYPNPATDVIKIEWSGFTADRAIEVKIVDMLGRLVMVQTVTVNDESLNIRNLAKGQHILQASQGNIKNRIRFSKE